MSRHRLPLLGVTGGIGSGKSTALAFLRELGAAVVSSDDVVHQLLSESEIVTAVRERFGDDVIDEGGGVSRPVLARVVFHDRGQLEWLEALLHPHVRRRVADWARHSEKEAPRPALLVAEVPLLFETGWHKAFDYTMLITAPVGVRRRRLSAKLTDSEFARRLEQQMPEDEKVRLADFVCHNTGSRKQLREAVREAFATIIAAGPVGDRERGAQA
jgi:dephospho-CoA kinase